MRVCRTAVSFLPLFLVLGLAVDAQALPLVQTFADAEGDAPLYDQEIPSSDVVWSTKRVRAGRDETIWFAIEVRFAGSVGGGLRGGYILLDTDRAAGWDASLYFRHWDNGSDADTCSLRIPDLGIRHRVRYRNGITAITCFLPKAALHATHRVRWFVRTAAIGQNLQRLDRAPDLGWYG